MLSTHRMILCALGIPCLTTFLACSTSTSESSDVQQSSLHIGSHQVLDKAEWQTYAADRQYIQSLAKPDVPVRLNMADDRQYRFVMTRLKIAGKTSKNSPYLMEAIEARRKEHLSLGVTQGLLPGASYTTENEFERAEMHFMAAATAGTAEDANLGEAVSTATVRDPDLDGVPYVYTDSAYYDAGGNPLSDIAYVEEFGEGVITSAGTEADLTQAAVSSYVLDSYHMFEDEDGFIQDSYVFTETGAVNATGRPQAPQATLSSVAAPVDQDGNQEVIVCLERRHGDCDYFIPIGTLKVRIPLQGSLQINSAHSIRQSDIDEVLADLTANPTSTEHGNLKLLLGYVGGGCNVQADGALHPSMKQVWDNIQLSPDGKTLSWNLTGNNVAIFDDSCRQIKNPVYLTMRLSIPVRDDAGIKFILDVTLSNDNTVTTAIHKYQPIRLVNSCLAAGTMVQLADGNEVAIESIGTGERISNPFHADAHALTVMDTSIGHESTPMYRLEDEAGRSILMTEMHPIQTIDRGMVAAKHVREGDMVMTRSGPSKLVRVTQEKYDGKVYNLRVGSEAEMASLSQEQTIIYANGFMVGDLQIQGDYELEDLTRKKKGDVLERLPARWHRDYQMSQAAKAARNARTPNGSAATATLAN